VTSEVDSDDRVCTCQCWYHRVPPRRRTGQPVDQQQRRQIGRAVLHNVQVELVELPDSRIDPRQELRARRVEQVVRVEVECVDGALVASARGSPWGSSGYTDTDREWTRRFHDASPHHARQRFCGRASFVSTESTRLVDDPRGQREHGRASSWTCHDLVDLCQSRQTSRASSIPVARSRSSTRGSSRHARSVPHGRFRSRPKDRRPRLNVWEEMSISPPSVC
jgi:hypothetical protein